MHIAHWPQNPWDIQAVEISGSCNYLVHLHIFLLSLSPATLPAQSLPSSISWPVYSECKCVHCVTAVILYCICLLKCGVKWILISQHRLIVYNQLCSRGAPSASLGFQDSGNPSQSSSSMHTIVPLACSMRWNRSDQYYRQPDNITILNIFRTWACLFLSCGLSVAREASAR